MKKIYLILLLTTLFGFSNQTMAQDGHRLANGEPYDIFYTVKPYYVHPMGSSLTKNYKMGWGGTLGLEFQFQEKNIGIGAELGYANLAGKSAKIQYLPRKYLFNANQIPFTIYCNYYLHNETTYYDFIDRIKPYVGLGFGFIWGKYDYSLSNEENKSPDNFGYYLRDYEGQSGFRFGVSGRAGILYATRRQSFGAEVSFQNYYKWDRLEKVNN